MARRRRPGSEPCHDEQLLEYTIDTRKKEQYSFRRRCCRRCMITGLVILILAVVLFILLFIVLPVTFMFSIELQRNLLFQRWSGNEDNQFNNFRKYSIESVRNFYVPVKTEQLIQLGTWHVLHLAYTYEATQNENFDFDQALYNGTYPVVLYFHGTGGTRITKIDMYRVLRVFFHVIAFDYRDYGDSTEADIFEETVVQDCIQLYKWLTTKTKADIYVWGHSLGTGLSAHTIARLRNEGIVPAGLFLESPFNTIREEFYYFPITKIFEWLPWFEATILDPMEANGFILNTTKNINSVDCPVMMVHADDDSVIPIFLAEKLYDSARKARVEGQGNVTLHKLPGRFGYGHNNIQEAPELPDMIRTHIEICEEFKKGKG